ncbi:MAG: AAA family ATPase [Casimicrobiaceae bacterium]
MQCSTCLATLPEAAKFCIACGAPAPSVCAACGFANLGHANFCAECGARLTSGHAYEAPPAPPAAGRLVAEPSPPAVERRQLTVLFCDLVGSTLLSSRLDPEELREVIGAYHRCVADTVERFGGFVARYMGDGALVYFGYPQGYEDNAERAVHAALALVANIVALRVLAERLHVRIGIATGLVVVGELVNAGAAREQTALGETPNLAARLQGIADPDAIVIAETTRRLVDGLFECRDLGEAALSGFAGPVRAWQVVGDEPSRRRFSAHDSSRGPRPTASHDIKATPLVGRSQELGLLLDCWKQVSEGRGRVVLVSGEVGIGKTCLVQALLSHVEQEPHAHLDFRCSAYYANSPLYPVVTLLPAVLGWSRDDANDARLEKLDAFCMRHHLPPAEAVPLLASLLSLSASERYPLQAMSPERQKQQTLQILIAIVLSFAAEKPLMIVVEDLHWIDPTSRQLLALLIDQVPTVPLFVLLTARLEFEPPWPPQSYVTPLMLTRLTQNEIEDMVKRVASGTPLPAEVVDEIVARTDGVPLFAEELTKMVLESGLIQAQEERTGLTGPLPLAIPTTLQDSLAARLDRLATVKPLAQLCATLGREFSYTLLKAVSVSDDLMLQRSLAQLVHSEFLHQRGAPGEAVYVFKHAMIQEAAYQSLLKSRRQQLHERIAGVIVEQFASEAEAHPEVVALHHTRAGSIDPAVSWWQKAGQHAFRRASYAESIAHYSSGLRALASLPDERRRDQAELALQVELGYALIPLRGWGSPQTAQAFSRAGELCKHIGDTPSQFRALWGVGAFHFVRGDQHKAREVADQCLELAQQTNDEDALIEAHYLTGIVRCVRGEFVSGCSELEACIRLYGTEAREMHRVLYGQDAKASALGWLAMALWVLGRPDEAVSRADEALALVRDSTQPFLVARGLAGVGFVRVFRREPGGPDTELPAALALCAEQGFTYFRAVVSAFHGANLVLLGNAREGIDLMQASLLALRTMGSSLLLTPILANLASAHLALDHAEEALAAIDEGLACVERYGERWAEAELLRARGQLFLTRGANHAQGEACLLKSLDVARGQQAKAYELRAATALASHWRQQGKIGEGKAALSQAIESWPPSLDSADLRDARELFARLG